ncbi:MAG: hypothetical protein HYX69_02245 [Planctomycetia bacterium]|nr:hypothetical protein [Planctomycetia bacterium]
MESLNNALAQLSALARSLPPRARMSAVALLAIAVAGLGWLVRNQVTGEDVYLFGGQVVAADELAVIEGALAKAQLSDFTVERGRICVPKSRQAACLAALADAGALPATFNDIFEEAAAKTTPFTSRALHIENMKAAKRKGLAMILRSMNEVESAEVDFDVQEPHGLRQERTAKALVAVKLRGGQHLDEERVPHVQRLVAGAIGGLTPQDVTVVDKATGVSFGASATGHAGSFDDPYHTAKRRYQAEYEAKVRQLLAVPGLTVSAEVELNRELRHEEKRVRLDASDDGTRGEDRPVARGGANQPDNLALLPTAIAALNASRPAAPNEARPAQQQTTTELAGLTPKRVAISVGVPVSYFEDIWRQRAISAGKSARVAPPAELNEIQTEVIARIEQQVATLIPVSDPSVDRSKLVTVTAYSHLTPPDSPPPSFATSAAEWIGSAWKPLAASALVIASLVMLRSLVRSSVATHATTIPEPHFNATQRTSDARARSRDESATAPATSIREELAGMVRQDPDAAAHILRSWISSAHS